MNKRLGLVCALTLTGVALSSGSSGCSNSAEELPDPGGSDAGPRPRADSGPGVSIDGGTSQTLPAEVKEWGFGGSGAAPGTPGVGANGEPAYDLPNPYAPGGILGPPGPAGSPDAGKPYGVPEEKCFENPTLPGCPLDPAAQPPAGATEEDEIEAPIVKEPPGPLGPLGPGGPACDDDTEVVCPDPGGGGGNPSDPAGAGPCGDEETGTLDCPGIVPSPCDTDEASDPTTPVAGCENHSSKPALECRKHVWVDFIVQGKVQKTIANNNCWLPRSLKGDSTFRRGEYKDLATNLKARRYYYSFGTRDHEVKPERSLLKLVAQGIVEPGRNPPRDLTGAADNGYYFMARSNTGWRTFDIPNITGFFVHTFTANDRINNAYDLPKDGILGNSYIEYRRAQINPQVRKVIYPTINVGVPESTPRRLEKIRREVYRVCRGVRHEGHLAIHSASKINVDGTLMRRIIGALNACTAR